MPRARDLGIEIGKLVYWNRDRNAPNPVRADRDRIVVLSGLLGSFMLGAVVGAFGFSSVGYVSTVPLAVLLAVLAGVPLMDDLREKLAD